jgi:hypothetical protein
MRGRRTNGDARVRGVVAKTAAEVIAERERMKREDPAYRAELERREEERAERVRLLRIAERPVVADLKAIGLDLNSVWDVHKLPDSRPRAIPVLLTHLALDYPDGVLQGIGTALHHKSARAWWADLREMMVNTERDVVRDRLAATLSDCATREHYEDLLAFLRNDSLGDSRIYFVRPINRIGNRIKEGQGRAVVEALADDPVLGEEATAVLKGRSRSE